MDLGWLTGLDGVQELHAQLDFLRSVQRTFDHGSGRLDLLTVFSKILAVAVPLVSVMAAWYYRRIFGFGLGRFLSRIFSAKSSQIIENYLVSKGVMLEVYLYSPHGVDRKVCNARVSAVAGGGMTLDLVQVHPTSLNLKNKRVICFVKPFTYSGRKINAFVTYVRHMHRRGTVIKELTLLTPIRYRFVIRRKHVRQKVARQGAVRVKAWDVRRRKTFWMVRPDLQTVSNPAKHEDKMRLEVANISAGGVRLHILNPKGELPPLKEGNQLVLRISVWNPETKKFFYFNVVGAIRSRFKVKSGGIGLGIQFVARGDRMGSGYTWKTLQGEIPELGEFLERIQGD
ncbi:hypothetical protein [Pseudodesulfovibrio tunisiensis]|uniref:hypothetical protein n=1 Tax=Pseudodesulfovibrio tunisiensis TaxID=463192 RepID=UPI001FB335C1|nr:hypothetical protein [Pseudodesulfovibrio tunisiensis]